MDRSEILNSLREQLGRLERAISALDGSGVHNGRAGHSVSRPPSKGRRASEVPAEQPQFPCHRR